MTITPGKYTGKVIKHTYGKSPQKGTPKFDIEFQIGEDGTDTTTMVFECWLTDAAMGMARKSLKAIGYDPDTMTLDTLVEQPMALFGHQAICTIVEEQWNDQWRMKIAFVDPVQAAPTGDELKRLTQALRDVKGSTKKKPVSAAPASKPSASAPSKPKEAQIAEHFAPKSEVKKGEDIPF